MTAQLVEYLVRLRFAEGPSDPATPTERQIGDEMHRLLSEIELVALEQEIVSRTVLAGPDSPPRVRCAARTLDPTRHYATSRRWRITTPDDEMVLLCSAACALSWLCSALPADLAADAENSVKTAPGGAPKASSGEAA